MLNKELVLSAVTGPVAFLTIRNNVWGVLNVYRIDGSHVTVLSKETEVFPNDIVERVLPGNVAVASTVNMHLGSDQKSWYITDKSRDASMDTKSKT